MEAALASVLRSASRAADDLLAAVADALPESARGCVDGMRAVLPVASLPGGLARGDVVDVGGVCVEVDGMVSDGAGGRGGARI